MKRWSTSLLNKPKDYITTTDDPQERRTVMQLVAKATKERIYPVGRLDRNTTGLLLLTNDGQLAEKLSHPRNNVTKIYHVELNKNLNARRLQQKQTCSIAVQTATGRYVLWWLWLPTASLYDVLADRQWWLYSP